MPVTEGYLYILINPSLRPDFLKIGMTNRSPEIRAKEISQGSGVPSEFHVAYEAQVPDSDIAEKIVHRRLNEFRINDNREFFCLPLKRAIQIVNEVTEEAKRETGIALRNQVDEILALIQAQQYEVSKESLARVLYFYSRVGKYLEREVGLVFRVALVALIFSRTLDAGETEFRNKLSNTAAEYFDNIIRTIGDEIVTEEIGDTLYVLPYHAYINRVFSLLALDRNQEAEQTCALLEVRLADRVLDKHGALREKLNEQVRELREFMRSWRGRTDRGNVT
jgi:hypothetical protein